MSEQLQVQKHKRHEELPEVEELPEPLDESALLRAAAYMISKIDKEVA